MSVDVDEVAKQELQRFAAQVASDVATLDRLTDDSLTYVHTNGRVEFKDGLLDAYRTGSRRWLKADVIERRVEDHGGVIVSVGVLDLVMETGGQTYPLEVVYTAAYSRQADLRLVAWHATKRQPA